MPEFTCAECGSAFSLPDAVLAKYPGWTPRQCRSCRDAGGGAAAKAPTAKAPTAKAPAAARGGRKRRAVEENLPVAEVLARHAGGPQDGVFTD
ncbi:MAG TPA: hypothetical protein VNU01_00295, partial [Egibacteraceae bacterium]|nr:hypothetical protein [Egibacteraceae bacterium]